MVELAPLAEVEAPLLDRREIAAGTLELTFDLAARPMRFASGQYLSLVLPETSGLEGGDGMRDFSIASSPERPDRISIAYRDSESAVKRRLRTMGAGTPVMLRGSLGAFGPPAGEASVALIAGGIGIAPFRSILSDPGHTGRTFGLFYWNRDRESAAYLDELTGLTAATARTNASYFGLFDPEPLAAWHRDHPDAYWLTAGPSEMVWRVLAGLSSLGVPQERIRTEEFTGYDESA